MSFVPIADGGYINLRYVKQLYIADNEEPMAEDDSDSHLVIALTSRLHEDETEIVFIGNAGACTDRLRSIVDGER